MKINSILLGDNITTLKTLPDNSVDCCVTSPPYYNLRDYCVAGQIGLEQTPEQYIEKLVCVFREVKRVLKVTATLWIVIADSYNGSGKNSGNKNYKDCIQNTNNASYDTKPLYLTSLPAKSLIGIPWILAFALRADGWLLRQDIIWHKPSSMPESVTDRFTKAHEYIFLFSKQQKYYFDHNAALEPATGYDNRKDTVYKGNDIGTFPLKNKRDVWTVAAEPSREKHYAMFPQKLIMPCILCGCPQNGIVLDPFMGSGTTAVVAKKLMRNYIGCEINPEYIKIAERRIADINPLFKGIE